MLVVDYQSKSYYRFLEDMQQIAKHKNRFVITLNGASDEVLEHITEAFITGTENNLKRSLAIIEKQPEAVITSLFNDALTNHHSLLLEKADLLFVKKTALKNSHERDCGFNLNHLFKSIAKHDGIVVLATEHKQTLSASMSTKVDVLVRFPSNTSL